MLKNILKILSFLIIGMIGGIFSTQIIWPYFVERPLFLKYNLERNPIYVTEKKEIYIQENQALQEAIKKVSDTVVKIKTFKNKSEVIEGVGIIVTSDGLILSLSKTIPQNFSTISIFTKEGNLQAKLLKKDKDLALLKIEKDNLKTVAFSNLENISLGERVFYLGINEEKNIVVNEGIITSFNQDRISTNMLELENLEGAPLFNIEGKLIGQIEIDKQGKVFAIHINKIKNFLGF